jgi:hypothetical protein
MQAVPVAPATRAPGFVCLQHSLRGITPLLQVLSVQVWGFADLDHVGERTAPIGAAHHPLRVMSALAQGSRTHRKPVLPVVESGVRELRAATR